MNRLAVVMSSAVLILSPVLAGCESSSDDLDSDFYLIDTCKDFVKDKLKAPSTADFSDESVDRDKDSEGNFTVTGNVDSENGFGAKIRAPWVCSIRVNESNDGWKGSATLLE